MLLRKLCTFTTFPAFFPKMRVQSKVVMTLLVASTHAPTKLCFIHRHLLLPGWPSLPQTPLL